MNEREQTVVNKTIELSEADILELLVEKRYIPAEALDTRVFFKVPTGGDYSGCEVEIDIEDPVIVKFKVITEK